MEHKKENEKEIENTHIIDAYDYLSNAASARDCTGLIPAGPVTPEEMEDYEDLYSFLPPAKKPTDT